MFASNLPPQMGTHFPNRAIRTCDSLILRAYLAQGIQSQAESVKKLSAELCCDIEAKTEKEGPSSSDHPACRNMLN